MINVVVTLVRWRITVVVEEGAWRGLAVERASFIPRASCRVVRDADARSEACAPHVPTPLHALLGGDPLM